MQETKDNPPKMIRPVERDRYRSALLELSSSVYFSRPIGDFKRRVYNWSDMGRHTSHGVFYGGIAVHRGGSLCHTSSTRKGCFGKLIELKNHPDFDPNLLEHMMFSRVDWGGVPDPDGYCGPGPYILESTLRAELKAYDEANFFWRWILRIFTRIEKKRQMFVEGQFNKFADCFVNPLCGSIRYADLELYLQEKQAYDEGRKEIWPSLNEIYEDMDGATLEERYSASIDSFLPFVSLSREQFKAIAWELEHHLPRISRFSRDANLFEKWRQVGFNAPEDGSEPTYNPNWIDEMYDHMEAAIKAEKTAFIARAKAANEKVAAERARKAAEEEAKDDRQRASCRPREEADIMTRFKTQLKGHIERQNLTTEGALEYLEVQRKQARSNFFTVAMKYHPNSHHAVQCSEAESTAVMAQANTYFRCHTEVIQALIKTYKAILKSQEQEAQEEQADSGAASDASTSASTAESAAAFAGGNASPPASPTAQAADQEAEGVAAEKLGQAASDGY